MIPDSTQLPSQITKASCPCTKVGSGGVVGSKPKEENKSSIIFFIYPSAMLLDTSSQFRHGKKSQVILGSTLFFDLMAV